MAIDQEATDELNGLIESSVTDEGSPLAELEQVFEDRSPGSGSPAAVETGTQGEEGTPTTDTPPEILEVTEPPPVATDPTTPADRWEWDDGLALTRDEAQSLAQFRQYLELNPAFADALVGLSEGRYELTEKGIAPATDPNAPPADLDLDDPTTKALWDSLQATRQELSGIRAVADRTNATLNAQAQANAQTFFTKASSSFQAERKLNDVQMKQVTDEAARLRIIESFMAPTDPVSGLPRTVDPLAAVEQALETAYWNLPEFRETAISQRLEEQRTETKKKATLSSLGGSSGPTSKSTPEPRNPAERREAMIRDIAEAMSSPTPQE